MAGTGAEGYFVVDMEDKSVPRRCPISENLFRSFTVGTDQADEPPAPIRAAMKQAAAARSVRLPIDELPLWMI